MGDTGSMALGGALAAFAIMTKTIFLLLLIGGIFVIEALSVIIQVFSFKYFERRVFLMAPIHHHFEMKAWSETKIMVRFWIVAGILCAVGFALYYRYFPGLPLSELPERVLVLGLARSGQGGGAALARRGVEVVARPTASSGTTATLVAARRRRAARQEPGRPARGAARRRGASGAASRSGARSSSATGCSQPRLVGVTGTNGKTTTTELLGAILGAPVAGQRRPRADASSTARSSRASSSSASCRASSSRTCTSSRCEVAVLLNLEPDHLDRHGIFEAYRDAKLRIFENQGPDDTRRPARARGLERRSSSRQTTRCRPSR